MLQQALECKISPPRALWWYPTAAAGCLAGSWVWPWQSCARSGDCLELRAASLSRLLFSSFHQAQSPQLTSPTTTPPPPDPAHPLLLPPSAWSVGSRTTHFPKLPSLPEAPFLPSSDGQPQILLRHGFSRVLPVSIPVCVGHHTELPHPRACPEPGHSCTSPPGLQ